MSSLVIVESPSKAKTIRKYLGKGFQILSSKGHVIDLPKKELGIDIENDFQAKYETISGKQKTVNELISASKKIKCGFACYGPGSRGRGHRLASFNGYRKKIKSGYQAGIF